MSVVNCKVTTEMCTFATTHKKVNRNKTNPFQIADPVDPNEEFIFIIINKNKTNVLLSTCG